MGLFRKFKKDINRYLLVSDSDTIIGKALVLWDHPEILAIGYYRLYFWIKNEQNVSILKIFFSILDTLFSRIFKVLLGVSISNAAAIGSGLYIGHYGGIFIGPIRMGKNCNISQGVTIGIGGRGDDRGVPTIGDRVYIGPGAVIFGKITIGSDVAIGANAVVTKSIPNNAVVVGIPGKIISYKGSKDFIITD